MWHRLRTGLTALTRLTRKADMRADPVIFVIGATGTGKSDLGVAIAEKWKGEVISSDSMQIYQGLDIATNKVTPEETKGIPHRMMSFLPPATSDYNVHDFKTECLRHVDEIRSCGKIPVIVGGTTYYVESVLYKDNTIDTPKGAVDMTEYDAMNSEELHAKLKEVDPESAAIIHPNNRYRVRRALEVFLVTGKKKSAITETQRKRLRFENTLVVMMDAAADVLDARLDRRVEKMRSNGLREELEMFWKGHSSTLEGGSFGVLQCIGLKEFLPYCRLGEDKWRTEEGDQMFEQGRSDVQLHTRQYSRKQRAWLQSRLVDNRDRVELPSLVKVDSSDATTYIERGLESVSLWLSGEDVRMCCSGEDRESVASANRLFHCDTCDRKVTGEENWTSHLNGKPHKNAVRAAERRSKREQEKEQEKKGQQEKKEKGEQENGKRKQEEKTEEEGVEKRRREE